MLFDLEGMMNRLIDGLMTKHGINPQLVMQQLGQVIVEVRSQQHRMELLLLDIQMRLDTMDQRAKPGPLLILPSEDNSHE
jgi:hypothetical protein